MTHPYPVDPLYVPETPPATDDRRAPMVLVYLAVALLVAAIAVAWVVWR